MMSASFPTNKAELIEEIVRNDIRIAGRVVLFDKRDVRAFMKTMKRAMDSDVEPLVVILLGLDRSAP